MNKEQTKKASPYNHKEAFALMSYGCACGHYERIWNSRDGVTPFGCSCPSCGQPSLMHVDWPDDACKPDHKLFPGQRFWRDGTGAEAAFIMARRIEAMKKEQQVSIARTCELINMARNGELSEFQKGWPILEVHIPFEKAFKELSQVEVYTGLHLAMCHVVAAASQKNGNLSDAICLLSDLWRAVGGPEPPPDAASAARVRHDIEGHFDAVTLAERGNGRVPFLNRDEVYEAVRTWSFKLNACLRDLQVTHAVYPALKTAILFSECLSDAVGNFTNPADKFAVERIREALKVPVDG